MMRFGLFFLACGTLLLSQSSVPERKVVNNTIVSEPTDAARQLSGVWQRDRLFEGHAVDVS